MKQIKLKNYHVTIIPEILGYEMNIPDSRVRRGFMRYIKPFIESYEANRKEICDRLCDKKDGKPIIIDDEYFFSPENRDEFDKEFEKLINEEVTIDILPAQLNEYAQAGIMMANSPVKLPVFKSNAAIEVVDLFSAIKVVPEGIPSPYPEI